MNNRLYRHPTDKVIGGVCAGMAAWLNIDPSLVRIAWVLLAIFTSGALVLVYLVMLFVVPLAPAGWMPPNGRPFAGGGPGDAPGQGQPGWGQPGWGQPGQGTAGWGPAGQPGQPGQPGQAGQPGQPGAAPGGWQPQPGQPWSPPSIDTGNAGIVAGAGLVILGVWFLVNQYVDIDIDWSLLWPVVIMLGGIALIVVAARRNRTGR